MKLKLEIKQIENVLLIKVLEDVDFEKLDRKALNNAEIYFQCGFNFLNNVSECLLCISFDTSVLSIREENGYQTYKFNTEQEATEHRKQIEKVIAKYNESLESKYPFEIGDTYLFIDALGLIWSDKWSNRRSDIYRFQNNNTFYLQKEAHRKLDIINFVNENKYEFTQDEWENRNVVKWYLFAYTEDKRLMVDCHTEIKFHNTPTFKDQETAQKVADFIGYDDFMKYC